MHPMASSVRCLRITGFIPMNKDDARSPAQAVLKHSELARVIRRRRRLRKQHSGDVSVGYDLALDSLVVDLAALVSDERLPRHRFIEACDPESAENDPNVINDIGPPKVTTVEQLNHELSQLVQYRVDREMVGVPTILASLAVWLCSIHHEAGGTAESLLDIVRETAEDMEKPELKLLRDVFPGDPERTKN